MAHHAADLIVTGGTIHTAEDAQPQPRAFAVRDGRFVTVGSLEAAMALRGPSTRVMDLEGKTVVPGLVDAHLHLTSLGLRLGELDVRDAASLEETVFRAQTFARETTEEWIVGRGWDQNRWPTGGLPVHDRLSEALPDRPVALTRIDGHALLANARAMRLAGIDETVGDPPGGRLSRDANGAPTGLFVDNAMNLIARHIPRPDRERLVRATRDAISECNRWGVTAVAEPGCDDDVLAAHRDLIERGGYSIRNHAMLDDDATLLERHFRTGPVSGSYEGRLSVRAVKMYADGALGSRGAALLAPYSDEPANDGLLLAPPEHFAAVARRAMEAGFQPCIHAIGDRANRLVLAVYRRVLSANAGAGVRARIEHAQVVAPADVPRFARLQVIASMQTSHALSDMTWARDRLGVERISDAYAWRRLLDAGASVVNGTDAPVEAVDTRRSFFAAIAGPSAAMTRQEALLAMTRWAACANFQDTFAGSIAPGKYADFVVLDRDWTSASPQHVLESSVLATYFAGEAVYAAPATERTDAR